MLAQTDNLGLDDAVPAAHPLLMSWGSSFNSSLRCVGETFSLEVDVRMALTPLSLPLASIMGISTSQDAACRYMSRDDASRFSGKGD